MRSIVRVGSRSKPEAVASRGRTAAETAVKALEARVELIQALIPLGLEAVEQLLQQEVTALAGRRYQRGGGVPGYDRWGGRSRRPTASKTSMP